jgi:antitoxin HigA-1
MNSFNVIDEAGIPITSDVNLHPGEVIEWEIEARGLLKKAVAAQLQINPSQLSELLKGNRHISASIALKLEEMWGISADFWMRTQIAFDLFEARQKLAKAA